jgi:hypothetical protein
MSELFLLDIIIDLGNTNGWVMHDKTAGEWYKLKRKFLNLI